MAEILNKQKLRHYSLDHQPILLHVQFYIYIQLSLLFSSRTAFIIKRMQQREYQLKLARRTLTLGRRTLIMGILNVTPDSFSDGGEWNSLDKALAHAEKLINDGTDIIDIGGESTRPNAVSVPAEEELRRVVPVIEELAKRSNITISIDTTKSIVARAALNAGAEIINDISGLRFDDDLAKVAADSNAGLILMHSRGTPEKLHGLEAVPNIIKEVEAGWRASLLKSESAGVAMDSIVLDPGIGFGKTQEQNVELIAKLDQLSSLFPKLPILVGSSRKSFIGKLLGDIPVDQRLHGTMATVAISIMHGAHIVRVHDVKAAFETATIVDAIKKSRLK
jgi:dihydropteroate synthase